MRSPTAHLRRVGRPCSLLIEDVRREAIGSAFVAFIPFVFFLRFFILCRALPFFMALRFCLDTLFRRAADFTWCLMTSFTHYR